jgi:hypothetical protein
MNKDENMMNGGQQPETPIIIIERDEEEPVAKKEEKKPTRKRKWINIALSIAGIIAAIIMAFAAYKTWSYYYKLGISISVSPQENIEKLQRKASSEASEVIMTSNSILGVGMDIYAIHGVQGTIEFEEPDTADASVYLYCRSVDFTAEGRYLSSLVANGKEHQSNAHRLGYMAMANGNNVIGFSRFEDVKDYIIEHGGSYFRQFVLVSNGELPPRFYLHGKVERCAIGRIGDRLYYITSHHKETMWSFADALREYGFIDAIYITGGYDYSFYRDRNGKRHDIHNIADYPHKKWQGITPWLVFRKN